MPTSDSLHNVAQALGVLQGETRANQTIAEQSRAEILRHLNSIDDSIVRLTAISSNIEEMRREYERRLVQIAAALAANEVRLQAIDVTLARLDTKAKVNLGYLTIMIAALGGLVTIAINYVLKRV